MAGKMFYSNLDENNKYILNCCFFIFAINGLHSMILGSVLPLISFEYGLNNTISGSLISAHQAGNLVSSFFAGILPLYLGRKKSIIFLCTFVMMGFLIMILTGNPVLLILGFLFTGLSRGSISNFSNTIVNEVSNSSPSALSFLHSIFAVGALIAPLLVIASVNITGDIGWRTALGVIIFLVAVSIFLFSKMKMDSTVKKSDKVKISYVFLKNKYFWISSGILFFYLCAESAINGWIVKYFVDSNIMTTEYAQMLASLMWAVILAGRLICAFLAKNLSKNTLLLTTSIGTAVFYFILLSAQDLAVITIGIIGLGFSMAGIYPATISTIGNTMKTYPMAIGVLLMVGGIGAILMPVVTGAVADAFGIFAGMSAIIISIVLMIVCVVLNLFGKNETGVE